MKNVLLLSRIENFYLRLRFNYFKSIASKKSFTDRKLVFSDDFKNLDNFVVKHNEFYNDNDVWFSRDAVSLVPEGVSIKCYKETKTRETWQGKRMTNWTSGMIETSGMNGALKSVLQSKGVWVITSNVCESWIAIWLLKNGRKIEGYDREQITPEIDVMEIINHKMRHTLHYGYADNVYRKYGIGSSIATCDNKFHEFAVELLDDGYKFYIDGILTAKFRTTNPEFVTNDPNCLLLNNAADKHTTENTDFIIKSVKVYE